MSTPAPVDPRRCARCGAPVEFAETACGTCCDDDAIDAAVLALAARIEADPDGPPEIS